MLLFCCLFFSLFWILRTNLGRGKWCRFSKLVPWRSGRWFRFRADFWGTPSVVRAVFCAIFGGLVRRVCGLLLLSFFLVKTLLDRWCGFPFSACWSGINITSFGFWDCSIVFPCLRRLTSLLFSPAFCVLWLLGF